MTFKYDIMSNLSILVSRRPSRPQQSHSVIQIWPTNCLNSASADGGPRSPHAGHSAQPPIGTSGNFPARVSAESPSNISPNPSEVISEVSELYDKPFMDIFDVSQFSGQNRVNWGGSGGPRFFLIGIFPFVLLGSPCKNL